MHGYENGIPNPDGVFGNFVTEGRNVSVIKIYSFVIQPSIHLSVYLFIYQPIDLSIYLFHPSIHPSISSPVRPSFHPFINLSIHPSILPTQVPSINSSLHPSTLRPCICPSIRPSVRPPIHSFLPPSPIPQFNHPFSCVCKRQFQSRSNDLIGIWKSKSHFNAGYQNFLLFLHGFQKPLSSRCRKKNDWFG